MAVPKRNLFKINGRPPKFETVEAFEERCSEYFESCVQNEEKATITGLALFLGFESRQSMHDYKEKENFSYVVKRAMLAVENSYETSATAFDIFALKNMGWKDTNQTEITGETKTTVVTYQLPNNNRE